MTRDRIYNHLHQMPGDHFRSIARSLNLSVGTASHHLQVLLREDRVIRRWSEGKARYYPKGHEAQMEVNRLYMQHWALRSLRVRILLTVANIPSSRPSDVARRLSVSRQLVSYHLGHLERRGHVRRDDGRFTATRAGSEYFLESANRVGP